MVLACSLARGCDAPTALHDPQPPPLLPAALSQWKEWALFMRQQAGLQAAPSPSRVHFDQSGARYLTWDYVLQVSIGKIKEHLPALYKIIDNQQFLGASCLSHRHAKPQYSSTQGRVEAFFLKTMSHDSGSRACM